MDQGTQLTILSVDDNPLMAEAVESIINSSGDFRHEGHFLSGEGVPEAVAERKPSVVLMDLDMPGTNACDLVRELTRIAPDTRVVMLSGHMRKDDIIACLDAGAVGYLHKDRSSSYIVDALRRAGAGEFVLCEEAARVAGMK